MSLFLFILFSVPLPITVSIPVPVRRFLFLFLFLFRIPDSGFRLFQMPGCCKSTDLVLCFLFTNCEWLNYCDVFIGEYDQNDENAIKFVHRQVHKNIYQRSLTGFITIINLKVCKPFIFYFFPYLAKVLFIKWHSNWVISDTFVKLCTRKRFICNYDWNHKVFILVNTINAIIAFYPILIWTKWTLPCVTMWKIRIDCPKIKTIIVN